MNKNFKKMTKNQKNNIYGGWAWLITALPFIFQSLLSAIASIKMISSDNGSVKYNGMQSTWSANKKTTSKPTNVKEFFYGI